MLLSFILPYSSSSVVYYSRPWQIQSNFILFYHTNAFLYILSNFPSFSCYFHTATEAVKAAAERSASGEDDEDHDNRKLKKVIMEQYYFRNNAYTVDRI